VNFSDHFGLTRVINLADRKDRYREVERQLEQLGTAFVADKVEVFPAVRVAGAEGFPSPGVRGCFLSHLGVLQDARARGVASVLVIEDDLEVSARDIPRLESVLKQLPAQPWGVLHLGHILELRGSGAASLQPFDGPIQTAHFYAIHRDILDRLIAYLEGCLVRPPGDPIGGPMHFDGALTMFRAANPGVATLVAQPSLGGQRSSRSDISYRRIEQVPGIKQAMGWARTVRRAVRA
jgi:glycosyl transferase, family 25